MAENTSTFTGAAADGTNSLALAAREMDAFGADHRVIPAR